MFEGTTLADLWPRVTVLNNLNLKNLINLLTMALNCGIM